MYGGRGTLPRPSSSGHGILRKNGDDDGNRKEGGFKCFANFAQFHFIEAPKEGGGVGFVPSAAPQETARLIRTDFGA